jgi:hypothetical protein
MLDLLLIGISVAVLFGLGWAAILLAERLDAWRDR